MEKDVLLHISGDKLCFPPSERPQALSRNAAQRLSSLVKAKTGVMIDNEKYVFLPRNALSVIEKRCSAFEFAG